jgi:hypothetical protein
MYVIHYFLPPFLGCAQLRTGSWSYNFCCCLLMPAILLRSYYTESSSSSSSKTKKSIKISNAAFWLVSGSANQNRLNFFKNNHPKQEETVQLKICLDQIQLSCQTINTEWQSSLINVSQLSVNCEAFETLKVFSVLLHTHLLSKGAFTQKK